jgi:hypothetical protein
MRHIPIDIKRFEAAKAATLRCGVTDKVPSTQSDSSLCSYHSAETNQHSEDEFESASRPESKSSARGAISSSSPTRNRNESGTGIIATREETHGTNSNNRPYIDIQGLIRSAQVRNMGRTK